MIPSNQIIVRAETSISSLNLFSGTSKRINTATSISLSETNDVVISNLGYVASAFSTGFIRLFHFDGTEEDLPQPAATGSFTHIAVSPDKTLLGVVKGTTAVIYDALTKQVLHEITLKTYNCGLAFSEDNLSIWAFKYANSPDGLSKYTIADGTEIPIGYDSYCSRFSIIPGTDDIIIGRNDADGFVVYDTTEASPWTAQTFTGDMSSSGTSQDPAPINITPNGKFAFGVTNSSATSTLKLNLLDMTSVSLPHIGSRYANNIHYYEGNVYMYDYGESYIDYASFDQVTGVMGPLKSIYMPSIRQMYIPNGDKFHIVGVITDTSEESQFVVTAISKENEVVGQVVLDDGVVNFDVPCPSLQPVTLLITGIARDIHETEHEYAINDIIFTNDSDRSYVCTAPGMTDIAKPAYPTSGTITDGTAEFTVRGKLAKPVTNFPVYPTVV